MHKSLFSASILAIMAMTERPAPAVAWESVDNPLSNNAGPERKRGNGNSVAQVKRAAIKSKNRSRNRAAHR